MRRYLDEPKPPTPFRNKAGMTLLGAGVFCMMFGMYLMSKNVNNIEDEGLQAFNYGINLLLWGIGLGIAGRLVYKDEEKDF